MHDARVKIASVSGPENRLMPKRSVTERLVVVAENRAAILAIQNVLVGVAAPQDASLPNPLFLQGSTGVGKTCLIDALIAELDELDLDIRRLGAHEFADDGKLEDAVLVVVEDLQHLPTRLAHDLVRLMDARLACDRPMIFTANVGPGRLKYRGTAFPRRLTSRLAGGLVVEMLPMQPASRRKLLKVLAEDASVSVASDVLDWLAENLTGGGRQIDGAIRQVRALQRLQPRPLTLDQVRSHFRTQVEATRPTMQRIAEHVSSYYHVKPTHVLSARRSRDVLLPRQVSMYLARTLTDLSFEKIGQYFGGRDHNTVHHACKKVAIEMKRDATLSGAVRQMRAELC